MDNSHSYQKSHWGERNHTFATPVKTSYYFSVGKKPPPEPAKIPPKEPEKVTPVTLNLKNFDDASDSEDEKPAGEFGYTMNFVDCTMQ